MSCGRIHEALLAGGALTFEGLLHGLASLVTCLATLCSHLSKLVLQSVSRFPLSGTGVRLPKCAVKRGGARAEAAALVDAAGGTYG